MILILCFLYCFFAIALGAYLGLELINVRKAERACRTILSAAVRSHATGAAEGGPNPDPPPAQPNYFAMK